MSIAGTPGSSGNILGKWLRLIKDRNLSALGEVAWERLYISSIPPLPPCPHVTAEVTAEERVREHSARLPTLIPLQGLGVQETPSREESLLVNEVEPGT